MVIPCLVLGSINAWNLWNEHWEHWEHLPPLEERVEYPYQNIRSKNFFWGDGDKVSKEDQYHQDTLYLFSDIRAVHRPSSGTRRPTITGRTRLHKSLESTTNYWSLYTEFIKGVCLLCTYATEDGEDHGEKVDTNAKLIFHYSITSDSHE